ncbi:MAG: UDP-2,4-diacetamido-2,4,6-trideoxy-beta-L-altropyranose hydrolase, partial [Zetaproteobacteria bacterium]|nr:UDP-2,4-diacetamido-2,4,6-trideoxy-beta-L-altropyranose hydrolase [Zetaproteobacteria bacterium]
TLAAIGDAKVDWLVVDHYALDARWEKRLQAKCNHLMVIDDLADRLHDCDLLLDQNLVEGMSTRYQGKVPELCRCLLGTGFSLLRPEFKMLRNYSLMRRDPPACDRLLVFMGGSDPENETTKVVNGVILATRRWGHVDVVVGQGFQTLGNLQDRMMPLPSATLHIQTPEMAKLMANADLAVTAGGSVTWEKCVLGLPSLVTILGENQRPIADMMNKYGAVRSLGQAMDVTSEDYAVQLDAIHIEALKLMSKKSSEICDGLGVHKVLDILGGDL